MSVSEAMDKIREKEVAKRKAVAERKAERAEAGEVNTLIIERTAAGFFYVRYSLSGPVPVALQGLFTSKDKLITLCKSLEKPVEY